MSFNSDEGSRNFSMIQELVNDQKIPNLISNLHEQIFPVPAQLPQSLKSVPQSNDKIIKQIKNSHNFVNNLLRGFYFQLFRLCFQMYDSEESKDYLNITKSIIFHRSTIKQSNNEVHYKHLAEFFTMMQEQDSNFQEIIAKYHQIDESILMILQQLVQDRSSIQSQQNQIENILNQLCITFQITLIPEHPAYYFQQSDLYLIVQNQEKCFLVYDQSQGEEEEQGERQEEVESQQNSDNVRSQISVSDASKSPSQLTQNNMKNDGNFSKQYTFQPQFRGEPEGFVSSNKVSQISNSINSKQCNSRPVSNTSYKSHLSSESEYKRHDIPNPYIKIESKLIEKPSIHNEKSEIPENHHPYTQDPFKKGAFKISTPYQISTKKLENPCNYKFGSYNFSSPIFSPVPTNDIVKQKQGSLTDSHYVNNSISNYYEGYYADIAQNNSMHSNTSKNDTIINIFGDMLKSGKYDVSYNANSEQNIGNRPTKKQIQYTQKILETQQEFQKQDSSDIYPNFTKKDKIDSADMMMGFAKSVNSINQHNSDFNTNSISGSKTISNSQKPQIKQNYSNNHHNQHKNYSAIAEERTFNFAEGPSSNIQNKTYLKNIATVNFDEQDSIFYKPKKSQLKVISEVTASKESISLAKNNDIMQDSKGSIYRQFSNTRILKLLKQPHKTKVQIMRNRFKGQHFNQ